MKKYFPLLFAEIYLIGTLLVFFFGPIDYQVDNLFAFLAFIFLYHFAYISGYLLSINNFDFKNIPFPKNKYKQKLYLKLLIIFSFLAFLIGHKNLTMSEDLIPMDFFENLIGGVVDSSLMYTERMSRIDDFKGGKFLNILYFFISFTKLILIPTIIFYWKKLTFSNRFCMISIALLSVFSGVSAGVNKLLFDFVILVSSSFVLLFFYNFFQGKFLSKKTTLLLMSLCTFLLVLAFWFFTEAMLGRGGSPLYVEGTSPLGHIKVKQDYINSDSDSIVSYLYVYLSYYIVQGYYGFAQALNSDFIWTYGLGNSEFLSRQVFWIFGYDFSLDTIQHRIDSIWAEKAQWHSFYGHLANDFHFIGVVFINGFLGFYLAALWKSFIHHNNFYAKYLLPLFVIMIIFTPANNQIFGFLETFSAFFILSILWFKSVKLESHIKN